MSAIHSVGQEVLVARRARSSREIPVLILACIVLIACSLYAAREEVSVFQRYGTVVERAQALDADSALGLSTASYKANLADCVLFFQRFRSLEVRFLPDEERSTILRNCLTVADRITQYSPSYSLGWFTGAWAALLLGDTAGFNERHLRSQLTAPNEQWMADLRVGVAEDNLDVLDDANRVAHEKDLRLMVSSGVGLRNVARRYIRHADFRERITALVEAMPVEDQQRFLDNLEWEMSLAGY